MTSTGSLYTTGNMYSSVFVQFHPSGDYVVHYYGLLSIGISTVDYVLNTITYLTSVPGGTGIQGLRLNPQGNMILVYGPNANFGGSVALYTFENGVLNTTSQTFLSGLYISDLQITSDGRFAFCSGDVAIYSFYLNPTTKIVTNTGFESAPPNAIYGDGIYPLRITPDGRILICQYFDSNDGNLWLASAFINDDGSLTWTGYKFPYGSTYANKGFDDALISMDIFPVYTTGIPKELWKDMHE